MKRSFESGSQKRKKKQQIIKQIQQLPKVDHYFCVKQGELISGTASTQQDIISDLPQLQAAGSTFSPDHSDSDTLSDNSEIGNAATYSETVDQSVHMKSLDVGV